VVKWENLVVGDIGSPYACPNYPIKSVQVIGTFGAGNVLIEGSNMPTSPTYVGARNPWGTVLNFNTGDLKGIGENTYYIRPRVMNGDATTDVDVYLLCVTER